MHYGDGDLITKASPFRCRSSPANLLHRADEYPDLVRRNTVGNRVSEKICYRLDLLLRICENRNTRRWPIEHRDRAAAFLLVSIRVAQSVRQQAICDATD